MMRMLVEMISFYNMRNMDRFGRSRVLSGLDLHSRVFIAPSCKIETRARGHSVVDVDVISHGVETKTFVDVYYG